MLDVDKWSDYLLRAESLQRPVAPITDSARDLTPAAAYDVQARTIASKILAGEYVVGAKLGLTSKAKRDAMGVDEPVYGVLTSGMVLEPEEPLDCGSLIHPRVEPELVFVLHDDLAGPLVTSYDVMDATQWIIAGLEVIDSRYRGFHFTHADVVADNTSAARFVLGPVRKAPFELPDLNVLGCNLYQDGRISATAAGGAIDGHPAGAVARLANWLGSRGSKLRSGDIVMSGGLTNALAIQPGSHVVASFAHLGSVHLRGV